MPIPLDAPAPLIGWSVLHASLVAVILLAVSIPLALRAGNRAGQRWLGPLIIASVALHFLGAVAQAELVRHYYGNSADFQRYDGQGAVLAAGIRHLHLVTTGLTIPGTGSVSVVTGGAYAIFGVDQLGGFFVFTWLSCIGLVAFYRAACLTVPGLAQRRYAVLLLLLPSLLYWPSQAGKESLMLLCLGLATYGGALLLCGRFVGFVPGLAGMVGGIYIRPHEVALLLFAFVVGLIVRRPVRGRRGAVMRWAASALLGISVLVAVGFSAAHFLHITSLSTSELTATIQSANGHLQKSGAGFGSSHTGWSASPLAFPQDVVTVLLEPLPWHVRTLTQVIALAENLLLVALAVRYRRQLAAAVRLARRGGMPLLALIYSVLFVYIFAALGNIGLLERERTLLFPLLLVLVCVPVLPRARQATPPAWDVPGVLVASGAQRPT